MRVALALLIFLYSSNRLSAIVWSLQSIGDLFWVPTNATQELVARSGAVSTTTTTGSLNSSNYQEKGLQQPAVDVIITFVNGIYHSEQDVANITSYLRQAFNFDVRSFYNPSSGSWVMDAYNAGYGLVLRPSDLVLAKQLASHLRSALGDVRTDGGRVLHIAHSGGAILTYLAAKYHLTSSEKNRIDVITLGGGRSLTHKYFRGRVCNYYARNDPVLLVDTRASRLLRKATNTTYALVRDSKHNTTFVYLEALARDPIFDHAMEGPTYRKALQWEALQLQQRLLHRRQREAREKDILRRLRKRAARYTGLHHFWGRQDLRDATNALNATRTGLTGRMIRKYAAQYTGLRGAFSGKYRRQPLEANPSLFIGRNLTRTDRAVGANVTTVNQLAIVGNASTADSANAANHTALTANTTVNTNPGKSTNNASWRLAYAVATVTDLCRMMRKCSASATGMRGAFSGKYAPGIVQQVPVVITDAALGNDTLPDIVDNQLGHMNMNSTGSCGDGAALVEGMNSTEGTAVGAVIDTEHQDAKDSSQLMRNDVAAEQHWWSVLRTLDDLFGPLVWGQTPQRSALPPNSAHIAEEMPAAELACSNSSGSARLIKGMNSSSAGQGDTITDETTDESVPPTGLIENRPHRTAVRIDAGANASATVAEDASHCL